MLVLSALIEGCLTITKQFRRVLSFADALVGEQLPGYVREERAEDSQLPFGISPTLVGWTARWRDGWLLILLPVPTCHSHSSLYSCERARAYGG
jgi:hypothetical protein